MTEAPSDDKNPYASPDVTNPPPPAKSRKIRGLVSGATWAIVSAFPISGFLALVFRFPVPLAGYLSGIDAVVPAMVAVLIYGILLGGFLLLGGTGATIGYFAEKWNTTNPKVGRWVVAVTCMSSTLIYLMILATLDKWIGPW